MEDDPRIKAVAEALPQRPGTTPIESWRAAAFSGIPFLWRIADVIAAFDVLMAAHEAAKAEAPAAAHKEARAGVPTAAQRSIEIYALLNKIEALEADNKRLYRVLRYKVITDCGSTHVECGCCGYMWPCGGGERHAPNCPAAPKAGRPE